MNDGRSVYFAVGANFTSAAPPTIRTIPNNFGQLTGCLGTPKAPKWSQTVETSICPTMMQTSVSAMPIRGAARIVDVTTNAPEKPPAIHAHGGTVLIDSAAGTGTRKARHKARISSVPTEKDTRAADTGLPSD